MKICALYTPRGGKTAATLLPMDSTVWLDKARAERGHAAWTVVIPARLASTGKRTYRRFRTQSAAREFAASLRATARSRAVVPVLTPEQAADAAAALAVLEGTGLSLTAAASLAVQKMRSLLPSGEVVEAAQIATDAPAPASGMTFAEAVEARAAATDHLSELTKRKHHDQYSALFRRCPGLAEADFTRLCTADIREALERAFASTPSYFNSARSTLCALYNWHMRRGNVSRNPVTPIDPLHVKETEIHALSPADLRALLAACRPPTPEELAEAAKADAYRARILSADATDLRPMLAIMALAGVRPAEARRLTWADVGWEESVISVRASASKTGGTRHIPMPPNLAAYLATASQGRGAEEPIAPPESYKWRYAAIRARAGFGPERPWQDDALRHSFATYWLKAGRSLDALQLAMGHRDKTLIYNRYTNMKGTTRKMASEWWAIDPGNP